MLAYSAGSCDVECINGDYCRISPNTVASGYTRTTESIVAVDRERQELYANRGVLCGVSRV